MKPGFYDVDEREFGRCSLQARGVCATDETSESSSSDEEDESPGPTSENFHQNRSDFSLAPSPTGMGLALVPEKRESDPSTATNAVLPTLPGDVLFTIAEHCRRQDLISFCLATKLTMQASIPHIYRYVDLSTHNRGVVVCSGDELLTRFPYLGPRGPRPEYSDSSRCTNIPVDMIPRQWSFMDTMIIRREYRKYIKVLKWTFLPPTDRWRTCVEKPAFWELMRTFENLRSFDLADLSKNWSTVSRRPSLSQGRCFPNASSVRLLGVMEPVVATSLLSMIDPAKLVRLDLDNVQCCGQAPYGTVWPLAPKLSPSAPKGHVHLVSRGYAKWFSANTGFIWPGAMRGLLFSLKGRCTGLKSLTLRKVGYRNREESDLLRKINECFLFFEWSYFIRSVSRTLEYLTFDQGPRHERQYGVKTRVHPVRTMDRYFGGILFPVLLAGPWPHLKRMELRGVRSWIGHGLRKVKVEDQYEGVPFAISLEEQLKVAVNRDTTIVVEGQGRSFDLVERPGLSKTRMS